MKLQFLSPAILDVTFTLDEIEERGRAARTR